MKPNTIYHGDALETLKTFPDGVVQTCITSPPYWGLRDYGTAAWEGGDPACDHKSGRFNRGGLSEKQKSNTGSGGDEATSVCARCGAVRIDRQLGLEKTPEEYVAKMVEVFREVHRVLKDDGTLWLNLGDSYSGSGRGADAKYANEKLSADSLAVKPDWDAVGLKPKDLVGIPWMVAFALRADGWYLRQDIIWHKPNPMPESVTDRCTKAHEYIFLMSKSARYYYDAKAIAEPASRPNETGDFGGAKGRGWKIPPTDPNYRGENGSQWGNSVTTGERVNRRSVWTVATEPFPEAHFATFPEKLIEPCILAGSKPGDIVLDPFFGSGTVGKRSKELTRNWVGIELNEEYIRIAERRLCQQELFVA